jgi:hypothetical protein
MKALLAIFLLALNANACPTDKCQTWTTISSLPFARFYSCSADTAATAFTVHTLPQLNKLTQATTAIVITHPDSGNKVWSTSGATGYPVVRLKAGKTISHPTAAGVNNANSTIVRANWAADGNTTIQNTLLTDLETSGCTSTVPNVDVKLYDSCNKNKLDLEQNNANPFCRWDSTVHNPKYPIDVYVNYNTAGITCPDDAGHPHFFQCYDAGTGLPTANVTKNPALLCAYDPCPGVNPDDVCFDEISSCNTKPDLYHNCNFFDCWDGSNPNIF